MSVQEQAPWSLPGCPEPPQWQIDWPQLLQLYPDLAALEGCPQDPHYHAEGDVLIHTRRVVEALASSEGWRSQTQHQRQTLWAATLFHDIGKPACTVQEADGRISSRGHASFGAQMTRQILWQSGVAPFAEREQVVGLVRYHGLPLWVLNDDDPVRRVILVSQMVNCRHLAELARADIAGRDCPDAAELYERLELFIELCREQGCLDAPWPFPSAHSRFLYGRAEKGDPYRVAYDETSFEVVLMSGLPGSGKDTWIARHGPDIPVISLDKLRQTLGIAAHKEQGAVVAAAREAARVYMRAGRPFIWNATNTSRRMRSSLVDFFVGYGARVRLVYLETAFSELLRRNEVREQPIPETVLRRLAMRLEVPEVLEAQRVEWYLT